MNYLDKEEYDINIKSNVLKYGTFNDRLMLTNQLSFRMKEPMDVGMNIDYRSFMSNQVSNEFTQSFENELKKLMCQRENFLDLTDITYLNQEQREKESANRLVEFLVHSKYDFIILNGKWASFLQNQHSFSYTKESYDMASVQFTYVGRIHKIDVYVDTFMKYNSDWVICGMKDSFHYNMKFDSVRSSRDTFNIVGDMNYSLKYNIQMIADNFLKLHLLYKDSEVYSKFITDSRDRKIDILLK